MPQLLAVADDNLTSGGTAAVSFLEAVPGYVTTAVQWGLAACAVGLGVVGAAALFAVARKFLAG